MTIDTNDLNVKSRQAQKFLESGNKVLVSIGLRGRQNAHPGLGVDVMNKFFEMLEGKAVMDQEADKRRAQHLDGAFARQTIKPRFCAGPFVDKQFQENKIGGEASHA